MTDYELGTGLLAGVTPGTPKVIPGTPKSSHSVIIGEEALVPLQQTALVRSEDTAQKTLDISYKNGALALAAGILASYFWKEHRVIGFFGGMSAGSAVADLLAGNTNSAIRGLVSTAGAVAVGTMWSDANGHDNLRGAMGYVGGHIAASIISAPLADVFAKRTAV